MLLAEELLLISLDDEKGTDWHGDTLNLGMAGALIIELASAGAVRVDDGKLSASGGAPPDDPLLAEAHVVIAAFDKPKKVDRALGTLRKEMKPLRDRVGGRLADAGILREEKRSFLGMSAGKKFPEVDHGPEQQLVERMRAVLVDGAEPEPREAALAGLLHGYDLVKNVVEKPDRKAAKKRAKQLGDEVTSKVASAVEAEVMAAIMPAIVAATSTAAISSS